MIAVNSFYRLQKRYLQSNMVSKVLVYDGRNIDCHASCFYARQDLTTTKKERNGGHCVVPFVSWKFIEKIL